MKLGVIALDLDAATAADGRLVGGVAEALREARRTGVKTVLVSGRMLPDTLAVLPESHVFDAIVAESGAVLEMPSVAVPSALAAGPDAALLAELTRRNVAHRTGFCMVESDAVTAADVFAALRALGATHGISLDCRRLTILPQGVSKATGLGEAVWRLGASLHNTVAIGGLDDDQSLLEACEIGAAVGWGSSTTLRQSADVVVPGRDPEDLAPYIRALVATKEIPPGRLRRSLRRLRLGNRDDGEPIEADDRGRNALVAGDPRSGKTWFVGLLCEQLILKRYSVCILDPEGDYICLAALPGVIVHRVRPDACPLSSDLEAILQQPTLSVVVDLSDLATEEKRAAARSLLLAVDARRRTVGVPHRVVLDEAHYFLHQPEDGDLLHRDLGGYLLATYRIADLAPGVLDACDAIILTRVADRELAARVLALTYGAEPSSEWVETLANLPIGEAVVLPTLPEQERGIARFKFAPRVTEHVRHQRKYVDVGVPSGREFVFTQNGLPIKHRIRTLRELLKALEELPQDIIAAHLHRGDFHRWIEDVVGDRELGAAIRIVEKSDGTKAGDAIVRAIRRRYPDSELPSLDGGPPSEPTAGAT